MVIKLTINGKEIPNGNEKDLEDTDAESITCEKARGRDQDWWDVHRQDFREMKICSTCYDLYGFLDYRGYRLYQKSDCQRNKFSYRKWDMLDFNEAITLCYCCGKEVLQSGSKFSCWFCSDCEKLLSEFKSMYRMVIPIGRHSFMAGIIVKGSHLLHNKDALQNWVSAIKALGNRMDVLFNWRTRMMQENFKILGLTDDILLFDYLSARDYLPTKDNAVRGLVEFFIAWEKNTMIPSAGKV